MSTPTHSRRQRLRVLLLLLGLAVITGAALWLSQTSVLDSLSDWGVMDRLLSRLGIWSAPFLVIAQMVQVLIPVIPSQLLGMASGLLYGLWGGTALSLAGTALGSLIAVALARHYGRPYVERHASAETIDRIDAVSRRFGSWGFFFVALIPFLPTDIGCFVAGLTPLRTRSVIVPIMLGRLPGIMVLNYLGTSTREISLETMLIITVFTLAVAVILWLNRDSVESLGHNLVRKLGISKSED